MEETHHAMMQLEHPSMELEAIMNIAWLNHGGGGHSPIRQFCPARVEHELQQVEPPDFASEMTQLPPSEVDQMVDTFFNVECYQKDNADKSENEPFDGLLDLSMIEFEDHALSIGVDEGLELVHLLLACAEAVGCRDASLADSILTRIWPRVAPWGDSLQRVCHYFAMGLKARLSLLHNVNPNGSFSSRATLDLAIISKEEKSEAFALLHQTTPYIAFGFMAANDAIFEAAKGKDFLHIIDLGMEHALQWPSLIRALSLRPEGAPKRVRITGLIGDQDPENLESVIKGLQKDAISVGISLEWALIGEVVSPMSLTREKLKVRDEEALFINSILHLHTHVKESRGSLKTILESIKKLNPSLVIVVEQDANHNGPFFLGRFLESLHYYSAVFDSLEASLARNSLERVQIERVVYGEEICNVVAYEGSDRSERHERGDQWRRQMGRAGFRVVGLKCLEQVKTLVSGYGYTVECDKGCLHLGWKGRPIMLASSWRPNYSFSK